MRRLAWSRVNPSPEPAEKGGGARDAGPFERNDRRPYGGLAAGDPVTRPGRSAPGSAYRIDEGLIALAAAVVTARSLARDPLADPSGLAPLGARFRALPTPRRTDSPHAGPEVGAGPAVRAATATAPEIVAQPTGPSYQGESPDETVRDIVSRAQRGDADAFGELYDRYVDLIYRYVYYRVGSRSLAEDLTSETFLRALRRITSFTWQGRDIGAWFVTIARNLIADHFKSGRYRLEIATSDMLDADQAEDGPEGAVLDAISNRSLLEAVKQLGAEQQECIVLRFLQGLSVSETALVMGKNEGAIKALQYRAVRALGRLLPEDFL